MILSPRLEEGLLEGALESSRRLVNATKTALDPYTYLEAA